MQNARKRGHLSQTTRADGPGMGLTMLSWPRVIRWSGPTKIWKFHPRFFTGKNLSNRTSDPSDRLFWDLSLCCLNMVYQFTIDIPILSRKNWGFTSNPETAWLGAPKFGSIRGPGTPRGRRARPGGPGKIKLISFETFFQKNMDPEDWNVFVDAWLPFSINSEPQKTSWLFRASKKPKPRCVAA